MLKYGRACGRVHGTGDTEGGLHHFIVARDGLGRLACVWRWDYGKDWLAHVPLLMAGCVGGIG